MNFKKDWKEKKWVPYTIAACSAVLLFVVLTHLDMIAYAIVYILKILLPVIIGIVLAYILDPLVKLIQKIFFSRMKSKRAARNISVVITVAVVIVGLGALIAALVPQLISSIGTFFENLDGYLTALNGWIDNLTSSAAAKNFDISAISNLEENLLGKVTAYISSHSGDLLSTVGSIGSGILTFLLGGVLAIYFLFFKERTLRGLKRFIRLVTREKNYPAVVVFLKRCNAILKRYAVFSLVDALIVGGANMIFMSIAGMPYGVLISVVVGVTNLAPTFGPIVGGAIGAFILLLVNPWYALWFLIFTLILQILDGYVLKPRLYGDTLGVSPVLVLISIIVGGRLFGVVGILIAIPFAAILDYIIRDIWTRRLERKKAAEKAELDREARKQEEEAE